MAKIKKWYRSIPIWLALFLLMIVALLLAAILSSKVTVLVNERFVGIQVKYLTPSRDFTDTNDCVIYGGDNVGHTISYDFNYDQYSDKDRRMYQIYSFALRYTPLLIYSCSIMAATLLFYFTKLKKPMALLLKASNRIAENELDFSIDLSGYDEMARLCVAFEKMRKALDENNQKMLRMIDDRKQLNDAYTHDLRTPIAVLKGHTDMLSKYLPTGQLSEKDILETVKILRTHISRLEQFVESMNTVQKLEDMSVQKESVIAEEFLGHLRESANILSQSYSLFCEFEVLHVTNTLIVDSSIVLQVYENLLSNAIRFAHSKISVQCRCEESTFSIAVTDDGDGFSKKDLMKADKPYYSGKTSSEEYHFGLGLHICRTLCEKHGGSIHLENVAQGGARVIASFCMEM